MPDFLKQDPVGSHASKACMISTVPAIRLYLLDYYKWHGNPASIDEICGALIISKRTARQNLQILLEAGEIETITPYGNRKLYYPSKELLDGKPCRPRIVEKTPAEVEELKRDWLDDPHWDLAKTPGFDAHREELAEFEKRAHARWERDRVFQRHMKAIRLECSVELAEELSAIDHAVSRLCEVGR